MLSGVWDAVVLLRALKTEKVKNAAGEGEEDAPRKASSGSEV